MAKSLASIREQIEKLEREAEVLLAKEAVGVITRIKEAIAVYKLTPADLFGAPASKTSGDKTAPKATKKGKGKVAAAKPSVRPVKYTDGTNTWVGHGKRPRWFVEAVESGKTAEDLLVKAA